MSHERILDAQEQSQDDAFQDIHFTAHLDGTTKVPGLQFKTRRAQELFQNECARLRRVYPGWEQIQVMEKALANIQAGRRARAMVLRNPDNEHPGQSQVVWRGFKPMTPGQRNLARSSLADAPSSAEGHSEGQTSGDSSAGTSGENQSPNHQ
jgi:hypothetical protein